MSSSYLTEHLRAPNVSRLCHQQRQKRAVSSPNKAERGETENSLDIYETTGVLKIKKFLQACATNEKIIRMTKSL